MSYIEKSKTAQGIINETSVELNGDYSIRICDDGDICIEGNDNVIYLGWRAATKLKELL